MIRFAVLLVLTAAAVGIALALQRRRPDPPSAPSYRAPAQLDLADFDAPHQPFLAVVFASTKCNTCPAVWEALRPLGTDRLAVQRRDVEDEPELHARYRIDGVPTTVFADRDGVVRQTFFGPVSAEELAETAAGLGATG